MPPLSNPRHEIFAQNLFQGMKQDDAYAKAGFTKNKGNASTLKNKPEIQNRLGELLQDRVDRVLAVTQEEISVTKSALLTELEQARQLALETEQPGAMVMASVAKARITGQIIDRREVGDAGAFDNLTDEELVASAAKKARELGIEGPQLVDDDEDKVA